MRIGQWCYCERGVPRGGERGSARGEIPRENVQLREREPIVEVLPREDVLLIAEPVAFPQKGGVL